MRKTVLKFNIDLAKRVLSAKKGRAETTYDSEAHITSWNDPHFTDYPLSGWVSGLYEDQYVELRWNEEGICMYDQKYNLHIVLNEPPLNLSESKPNKQNSNSLMAFDIESATIAVKYGTGRIVTRSGRPVTITEYNESWVFAVQGVFTDVGTLGFWSKDGKSNPNSESESDIDLFIEELC